jgi:fatty-acid peroxygenase
MSALCFVLAASAVFPLVRVCVVPRFWRMFPRVSVNFALASVSYWAGLGAMGWWFPAFLPVAAAASLVGWAWLWWRSRDGYGRRRRLPPGSLAPLPLGPWFDRFYYTQQRRRHGSIYKTSHFFHPMICIMNLDAGLRLLKAHDDRKIRSPKVMADRFLPCGFLRGMDPENHATYRRLVQSLITPQVLAAWEPTIASDLRPLIEELSTHRDGVSTRPAWGELLARSFARLFFGIAPDTPDYATLRAAFATIKKVSDRRISVRWLPSERQTQRTLAQLTALLQRQTAPGCLLAELRRQPQFAGDPQALRLLLFIAYLSSSDVEGFLQWLLKTLCDYPQAGLELRAEFERGVSQNEPDSLSRRFVLETLRRNQVEHLYRRVLEEFEWEGYRFPKGWLVRICLADAHRDERVFAEPSGFCPERFREPPPQSEFLPFGAYQRSCPGDKITHVMARVFLETLTTGWDWRQEGPAREDYHAWHWTPGADFRVVLTKRADVSLDHAGAQDRAAKKA